MTEPQLINAVFEGGGVKGVGLVGAVSVTEERGYQFRNVAGTSAGAIISTLIAAGYSAVELKGILDELDYNNFKDKGLEDKIPLVGLLASAAFEKGIYEGDFFLEWIQDLLDKKGVNTFGDLVIEEHRDNPKYRYRLQVIAADVTRGKMLVLPRDIAHYGIDPDSLGIARAVRMSMAIHGLIRMNRVAPYMLGLILPIPVKSCSCTITITRDRSGWSSISRSTVSHSPLSGYVRMVGSRLPALRHTMIISRFPVPRTLPKT